MNISVNSYLNGALQNTWSSNTEKQKQRDSSSEVGKTQQSEVSVSLDQVNMGEDGTAITEVSRQQGAEHSTAQRQCSVPSMDTVEISAEGAAASAAMQEANTSSVESYEQDDLSTYTDSELKQMYYNGEITLQEYEEETGKTLE